MTVEELIYKLKGFDPEDTVTVWDPPSEKYKPLTDVWDTRSSDYGNEARMVIY